MRSPITILIFDIAPVVHYLVHSVPPILEEQCQDLSYTTACIDWCIKKSITNVYNAPVVDLPYSHDFDVVYNTLSTTLDKHMTNAIPFHQMSIVMGCEIKVITNGRDLFITINQHYS